MADRRPLLLLPLLGVVVVALLAVPVIATQNSTTTTDASTAVDCGSAEDGTACDDMDPGRAVN
jgi:hypothetical protein